MMTILNIKIVAVGTRQERVIASVPAQQSEEPEAHLLGTLEHTCWAHQS